MCVYEVQVFKWTFKAGWVHKINTCLILTIEGQ